MSLPLRRKMYLQWSAPFGRVGTGFLCPTVVTGSFEGIGNSLRAILKACEVDSRVAHSVLGIHLEGPYISAEDGPRGAHPLEHVREPDWDEFQRWQDIAEGQITIVTLAPEKKGAIPFIEKLIANGDCRGIGTHGCCSGRYSSGN